MELGKRKQHQILIGFAAETDMWTSMHKES